MSDYVTRTQIPVQISCCRNLKNSSERLRPVRKTLKRNNNLIKALELPKVMNINPRSIYNKAEEFCLLLDMYESDLIFMSESWDRKDKPLDEIIKK